MFQQFAEGDQGAEHLIRGFQPDQALRGPRIANAATAHNAHRGVARDLDRVTDGAAVKAGVCFPFRFVGGGIAQQRRKVTRQGG